MYPITCVQQLGLSLANESALRALTVKESQDSMSRAAKEITLVYYLFHFVTEKDE